MVIQNLGDVQCLGESALSNFKTFVALKECNSSLDMQAVEDLSGKDWNGQKLYAARAQKRAERQMDLKSQFEKRKIERINRYQGVNLYVKNLDDTIDDARLREEFSAYGTITSAKVMMDERTNSKGMRLTLKCAYKKDEHCCFLVWVSSFRETVPQSCVRLLGDSQGLQQYFAMWNS